MHDKKFKIDGLNCVACVKLSIDALERIPGVEKATVDIGTGQASILATRDISQEEIINSLNAVGKKAII